MGMFDQYEPVPQLACPVCHVPLVEWQGKEGPCAILQWRQGTAWPVDQPIDEECRIAVADREKWRLPEKFGIYSYDCGRHRVYAECVAPGGVWTVTRIVSASSSHESPPSRDRDGRVSRQRPDP